MTKQFVWATLTNIQTGAEAKVKLTENIVIKSPTMTMRTYKDNLKKIGLEAFNGETAYLRSTHNFWVIDQTSCGILFIEQYSLGDLIKDQINKQETPIYGGGMSQPVEDKWWAKVLRRANTPVSNQPHHMTRHQKHVALIKKASLGFKFLSVRANGDKHYCQTIRALYEH